MKKTLFLLIFLSLAMLSGVATAAPEDVSIDFFAGEKFIETKGLVKGECDKEYCASIPSPKTTRFKLKSKDGNSEEIINIEALKKQSRCLELPFFFGTIAIRDSEISLIPWASW